MKSHCPYCNTLHKAIENQNYCSQKGDNISDVSSNAYYFRANQLSSGEHISRLSIRTISDGYQRHTVSGKQYMLDNSNYLVVPEGASFQSEIHTNKPVEGVLVAFNKKDAASLAFSLASSVDRVLDDPFGYRDIDLDATTADKSS